MTRTASPALARFLEARSDTSGRALPRAGLAACHALADVLDEALRELAGEDAAFAVVAVGGYGRREQCRHSDIDVMLLLDGPDEHALRALYPLWDAGLKVGHSVRTVPQAMAAAESNVETLTALLDTRLVAGNAALYDRFLRTRRKMVRAQRRWLRAELVQRHARTLAREPWQLLAVDLKNSRGGLRAVHAIHWLDAAEAVADGRETPPLEPALAAIQERLLCTRNAVHALAERPRDVYRPEQADAVAAWLGVDSLEWGRALYAAMRVADAAVGRRLHGDPARATRSARWPFPRRRPATPAAALSPGGDLDALRARLHTIAPGGPLDPLPPSRWLERLLPEWEVLRARPHIAPFHIHPVDVHVMRAVFEATRVFVEDEHGTGTPAVALEFGGAADVLLAMLLHDIGKGHGGNHSEIGAVIAERFATRAALPPEVARRLVAAVRLHLLLPNVATRRDIADPAVIAETAARIGDAQTLRLLYLLSIADARASGPNVWGQWKAQLMRAFYRRLLAVLAAEAPDAALPTVGEVVAALAGQFPAATIEAHLAGMGADYLLSTPAATIGQHLALIAEANGGTAARHDRLGELDRLTVVTPDKPGLLRAIAGTLACHNANVLGGVAHTHDDGVAIQVWHVTDTLGVGIDERRWQRILDAVPAAIAGVFPIDERLAEVRATYPEPPRADVPTAVHIDNAASREYTVLEVSTADRRGLLYSVTKLLHQRGIDIHLAKVDTIGPEVVDAFYIRRENGRRIDGADEVARLRHAVIDVLEAL